MRFLILLVALVSFVASGCGDDGGGDGDVAAFCDAARRIEESDPFAHIDDRGAYDAAIEAMESALADARSNAPSEIVDAVDAVARDTEEVIAALRAIEDPSDETEVEAALSALGDAGVGVTSGSDLDAYLVANCDG